MDLLKMEEWHRQLDVVLSAPLVLGPLVIFVGVGVASAAWWLARALHEGDRRGFDADRRIFEAELTGFKQQLKVREEQLAVLDQRLRLADERARDQKDKREEAERQLARISPEIWMQLGADVAASQERYQASSRALEQAVIKVEVRANEEPDRASFDGTVR